MSLELMFAWCLAGLVPGAIGMHAMFEYRRELRRVGRIVRANVGAILPKKRPTLEIALHADLDVDMKWWDEEFAKLDRKAPTDQWLRWAERRVPTVAELDRWSGVGITSVTDGDLTFDIRALSEEVKAHAQESEFFDRQQRYIRQFASKSTLLKTSEYLRILSLFEVAMNESQLEDAKAQAANSIRAAENVYGAPVRPHGVGYSLQEAMKAGMSFETVRRRVLDALAKTPGAAKVKRSDSAANRAIIETSDTWEALIRNTRRAIQAIEKAQRCDDCEYVEYVTYASSTGYWRRTSTCWKCEQEKLDMEKRGYALAN